MNPEHFNNLAARLRENPTYFEAVDESLLGDLIFTWDEGSLSPQDAAGVASLVESDPRARIIHQRMLEAKSYATSAEGKAWLESMPEKIVQLQEQPLMNPSEAPRSLLSRLGSWLKHALQDEQVQAPVFASASSCDEEFRYDHLDGKVASRLWQNENGDTKLWLMAGDASYRQLQYSFEGGGRGSTHLEEKHGAYFAEIDVGEPFDLVQKQKLTVTQSS